MNQGLRFTPRPRRAMEALDLGLGLLQAQAGPVLRVCLFQLALLLALLLPFTWRNPARMLPWLLWLTPWLNRGTVHVLSRAVFGQEAGVWTFLTHFRAVHRHGLLASLLWRRLSPARSFLLPVWQLEGQGRRAYVQRARVLMRQGGWTAFLLGALSLLLLGLTLFGALGLLELVVPRGAHLSLWETLAGGLHRPWFNVLFTAFGIFALLVVEPYYAAAGFALYLNRRTHLEAWDLEQAFRTLADRLRRSGRVALLLLGLGLGLGAQAPDPTPPGIGAPAEAAQAGDAQVGPLQPEDPARKALEDLLRRDPDLKRSRTEQRLQYHPSGREPQWLRRLLERLFGERPEAAREHRRPLGDLPWWKPLAWVLKALLVVSLLGLALYLLIRFHAARLGRVAEGEAYEAPEAIAGLEVRPESLPEDLPTVALALHRKGEVRGALALLYRGALSALIHGHRLPIPASATEGDCLRAAGQVLPEAGLGMFRDLTREWVTMAYQGAPPAEGTMEALCQAWRDTFGKGAR